MAERFVSRIRRPATRNRSRNIEPIVGIAFAGQTGHVTTPPASMRALAQRLLALEAAGDGNPGCDTHDAVRVCEKLRTSLSRFAGGEGFTSLMRRSLAFARAEIPSLHSVQVKPDGSIVGFEAPSADAGSTSTVEAVAITSHLLGLLVTFIGEPITLRLVGEAWPEATLNEEQERNESV